MVKAYQHDESDIIVAETGKRVAISAFPLYSQKNDKQLLGTVIVFRDITHESVEQKSNGEFIAHVAHELKAPLNVLFMYSETLLDHADASRELTIEAANVIHDETERIAQMIDNLLNLTMIEMGTVAMRRQRVKVADFLEDIYQTMSRNKLVETMEFDLKLDHDLVTVQMDKNLVRVCINNLISNAIKYHDKEKGKIDIFFEDRDNMWCFGVNYDGPGIPEQFQHKVFQIFQTMEARDKVESTGIGLSIVQKIVEEHGGKIWVESEDGKGAAFKFTWPK